MFIREATIEDLEVLAKRCINACEREGWKRDWTEGGCYLHLEVSELIESLRGKKGLPDLEAANVLFVLLAVLKHHNIKIDMVFKALDSYLTDMETVKV